MNIVLLFLYSILRLICDEQQRTSAENDCPLYNVGIRIVVTSCDRIFSLPGTLVGPVGPILRRKLISTNVMFDYWAIVRLNKNENVFLGNHHQPIMLPAKLLAINKIFIIEEHFIASDSHH